MNLIRTIIYDLETSGLTPGKNRIIEIGAIASDGNQFSRLIKPSPDFVVPPRITEITGIRTETLEGAPEFESIIGDFNRFCTEKAVLVAHNNERFDQLFLENEYKHYGKEIPEGWIFLDTLQLARKLYPEFGKSHSLKALGDRWGFEEKNTHRAIDDCLLLGRCFSKMKGDREMNELIEICKSTKI